MKEKKREKIFLQILNEELSDTGISLTEKEKMKFIKKTIEKYIQSTKATSVVP